LNLESGGLKFVLIVSYLYYVATVLSQHLGLDAPWLGYYIILYNTQVAYIIQSFTLMISIQVPYGTCISAYIVLYGLTNSDIIADRTPSSGSKVESLSYRYEYPQVPSSIRKWDHYLRLASYNARSSKTLLWRSRGGAGGVLEHEGGKGEVSILHK
jgi:hypothetical protein